MYTVVAARIIPTKTYTSEIEKPNLKELSSLINAWDSKFINPTLHVTIYEKLNPDKPLIQFDMENRWIFDIWYQDQTNAGNSNET